MITTIVQDCEEEGYAIVPGFLTRDDLDQIHRELRELADAVGKRLGLTSTEIPPEEIDRAFVEILQHRPDWQSVLYQRLQQVPRILAVSALPQVEELARKLLKTEAIGVWPRTQIRLDLFEDAKNVIRWHHDYMYNRGTQESFTFWIPLTNVDASMGLLQVARESHKIADGFQFEKTGDINKFDYNLDQAQVDRLDIIIPQSYNAGDLVVFHSKTIHSGALNTNRNRARLTLLFRMQNLHSLEDL